MTSKERHEARYQRRKASRVAKSRKYLDQFDNFEKVSSIPALLHANWESRKGVMFKASVTRYNLHYFTNAARQSKEMRSGKDIRRGFYSFSISERGKHRDIHSLHYSERVIRRSVCTNALVPLLSHNLIYDNGASLKGKGVSFTANRCEAHLHKHFRSMGCNDGYVLIVDFRNYFGNILHKPLIDGISEVVHDPQLFQMTCGFIASGDLDRPAEEHGKGLYIGPEDSQIYAVFYPNKIDHLIKDKWRKLYSRYMDDSYIIFRTKEEAVRYERLLLLEYQKYGIIPNPKKTQIVKISRGFTFLKTQYILTDTGRVVRKPCRDGIVRERRKLKRLHRLFLQGIVTMEQVTQSYMSWRGAALKRDAYRSVHSMDVLFYDLYMTKPWVKNTKKYVVKGAKAA